MLSGFCCHLSHLLLSLFRPSLSRLFFYLTVLFCCLPHKYASLAFLSLLFASCFSDFIRLDLSPFPSSGLQFNFVVEFHILFFQTSLLPGYTAFNFSPFLLLEFNTRSCFGSKNFCPLFFLKAFIFVLFHTAFLCSVVTLHLFYSYFLYVRIHLSASSAFKLKSCHLIFQGKIHTYRAKHREKIKHFVLKCTIYCLL